VPGSSRWRTAFLAPDAARSAGPRPAEDRLVITSGPPVFRLAAVTGLSEAELLASLGGGQAASLRPRDQGPYPTAAFARTWQT
jgi:hypothetical protein